MFLHRRLTVELDNDIPDMKTSCERLKFIRSAQMRERVIHECVCTLLNVFRSTGTSAEGCYLLLSFNMNIVDTI